MPRLEFREFMVEIIQHYWLSSASGDSGLARNDREVAILIEFDASNSEPGFAHRVDGASNHAFARTVRTV
jgi:hypothetical protein